MPNYDPITITFNDKPRSILTGMDGLLAQRERLRETSARRRKAPLYLFLAGLPFVLIDLFFWLLGYRLCAFSLVTPAFWIAALVMAIVLRRNRSMEAPPNLSTAREIIHTLRDDLQPGRNFFGKLDLTGPMQRSKLAREADNQLGQTVEYYRDEWMSLKAKLYDGNMLRLSLIESSKQRKGYWKRSRVSGKMKWKSPKFKGNKHELKVRLSVNPEVYEIVDNPPLQTGAALGVYFVEAMDISGGIINLSASTQPLKTVEAQHILSVLSSAYGLLQRKASA